jgi:hypothetical protein
MAARDLDNGGARPRRHLALGRWGDHPVFGRDEVPTSLFRKGCGAGGRPGCRAIGSVGS